MIKLIIPILILIQTAFQRYLPNYCNITEQSILEECVENCSQNSCTQMLMDIHIPLDWKPFLNMEYCYYTVDTLRINIQSINFSQNTNMYALTQGINFLTQMTTFNFTVNNSQVSDLEFMNQFLIKATRINSTNISLTNNNLKNFYAFRKFFTQQSRISDVGLNFSNNPIDDWSGLETALQVFTQQNYYLKSLYLTFNDLPNQLNLTNVQNMIKYIKTLEVLQLEATISEQKYSNSDYYTDTKSLDLSVLESLNTVIFTINDSPQVFFNSLNKATIVENLYFNIDSIQTDTIQSVDFRSFWQDYNLTTFSLHVQGTTLLIKPFKEYFSLLPSLKSLSIELIGSKETDPQSFAYILQTNSEIQDINILVSLHPTDSKYRDFTKLPYILSNKKEGKINTCALQFEYVTGVGFSQILNFYDVDFQNVTIGIFNYMNSVMTPGYILHGATAEHLTIRFEDNQQLTTFQENQILFNYVAEDVKNLHLYCVNNPLLKSYSQLFSMLAFPFPNNLNFYFKNSISDLDKFNQFSSYASNIGVWTLSLYNDYKIFNITALENSYQGLESFQAIELFIGHEVILNPLNSLVRTVHNGPQIQVISDACTANINPANDYLQGYSTYFIGQLCIPVKCISDDTTCADCRNNSLKGKCKKCLYGYEGAYCTKQFIKL